MEDYFVNVSLINAGFDLRGKPSEQLKHLADACSSAQYSLVNSMGLQFARQRERTPLISLLLADEHVGTSANRGHMWSNRFPKRDKKENRLFLSL